MQVKKIEKDVARKMWVLEGSCANILNENYFINKIEQDLKVSNNSFKTHASGYMTKWNLFCDDIEFIKIIENCRPMFEQMPEYWDFYCNDAWGLKYDKKIHKTKYHNHDSVTGFVGILYLGNNGPGTYINDLNYTIKEERGKVAFFHKNLFHQTLDFNFTSPRYIIPFNFNRKKEF
jgi:hypothetical protein|tara:strand:+ start:1123 stop:1650 length:528 start_codon:yes stop_codon:yes gene_type:complete